ncbi:MAG TPA: GMC family oxidoreductase [Bryobacteraceae bacterium]|jgi:choline dehydrogenase-like flavoprotein|nr:GMC family oxidoreductase [Bryobacteraceae bacterium]
MQIRRSPRKRDVVIIGSGASGGMAAWNLTRKGVDVLMLDAGVKFDRARFWSHVKTWEVEDRLERGQRPPQFYVDTKEQPYMTLKNQPFDLVRVWGRGGKTNVWGRVSLRYSDVDFTGAARDGWEIPWPIRYKDIAPYYDQVDQFIGVCGGSDDQDTLPGSRYHLPAPPPRCGERLLQKAARGIDISIVSGRRAVLTRAHNGHPACHYCGACGKGCDIAAFFNSSDYLIEPALASGKLEVVNNAVAARVLVDENGRASGVQYFDRNTKEEHKVYARVVIVAASTIDSTRILLNSKSGAWPNGIGNSSGVIGRYLTEQVRFHMYGFVPELMGGKTQNDDGIGGEHIYMPRFNHRDGRKRDYLRGFGMQFWGCGASAGVNFAKDMPGFGAEFKAGVKKRYPALVALHPYGEVLPRRENRVTVEGTPLDSYGVPIARIDYKIGDNERRMTAEMYDTAEAILRAAKAEILPFERNRLDVNGSAIHEHGTCRMGQDPKRSALNGYCQSHDVPNLFVVDGSAFTTATEKNPTLTILALAWRATDYLAQEMKSARL